MLRHLVPNRVNVREFPRRIKKFARRVRSFLHYPYLPSIEMLLILDQELGHRRSRKTGTPVDRNGDPIPWYTYPAFEYLRQIDFSDKRVFEWGAGNSSLYWAKVAKSVTSVESDPDWFKKLERNKLGNLTIQLVPDQQEYVNFIAEAGHKYDVIAIDGLFRNECSIKAPKYLASGGLILLDNSDWWPEAANSLKSADLIQVDMNGFGAINEHLWTTTLFFHRSFRMNGKNHIKNTGSNGRKR